MDELSHENYVDAYSDDGFWHKLTGHYKKAGIKLVELAISMYYAMRDNDTPKWATTIIVGALGYFILPVDIIPDFVPIAGFTDDFMMLSVALAAVGLHIKNEHKDKAKDKVIRLFHL
ncbi:MAG: DUF1232 domain-containing protein [Ignavibacteria bacterium]|jgi:uncharacterized membrane protein YkvA (DUF1232 family)|nr:DUF1232 domain-containing protein [Ignavibacteria bacterium]